MNRITLKRILILAMIIAAVGAAIFAVGRFNAPSPTEALASGNGRIEATEVDIAAKLPGRLAEVLVREGDMVRKDQILARLDTKELDARLKQAQAYLEQMRQNKTYAAAVVSQRESERALAQKNLQRSRNLYVNKNISLVQLQQHETALQSAEAALAATRAQVVSAAAAVAAAEAQVETVRVSLDDCVLRSPVTGRVLYRLREPGEMIGSGGKILTLLELSDVYMTIFLPTAQAGRIDVGSEARIVLDALPKIAIPAKVTFISPEAQFTPKEIETRSEREKLMFRVKIRIDPVLLNRYPEKIKTGLPGTAYVRLDADRPWPSVLSRLPNGATTP